MLIENRMRSIKIFPLTLHSDERGYLMNPLEEENIKGVTPHHFHVYTIEPGFIRGNHLHSVRDEYILSFLGSAILAIFDPDSGNILEKHVFEQDKPAGAFVPRETYHCLYNHSKQTFIGASFSKQYYADKDETVRSAISWKRLRSMLTED